MLKIQTLPVTTFAQNCRLLSCSETGDFVVVDPGGQVEKIESAIEALIKKGGTFKEIWLTHSHLDHCGAVAALLRKWKVPLLGHKADSDLRRVVAEVARMYGLEREKLENCPEPDRYLVGGDVVTVGKSNLKALFTPGHAPGHLAFYSQADATVLAGDALFAGSIGRTDMPYASHDQLLESIRKELLVLPDETKVLPGHGPDTTIGREKKTNPYLQA